MPAFYRIGAIVVSILLLVVLILVSGESPLSVTTALWNGAFGTFDQMGRVVSTLTILLLCASGLVFTFTAGLYNLGIEGQVTVGAIVATWALRTFGATEPAPGTTQVCRHRLVHFGGRNRWHAVGVDGWIAQRVWQSQRNFRRPRA